MFEFKHVEGNEFILIHDETEIARIYTAKDTYQYDIEKLIEQAWKYEDLCK